MHRSNIMYGDKIKRIFIAIFCLFMATNAFSDSLTFSVDNDLFTGTDRHYTHGTRLTFMYDEPPNQLKWMDNFFKDRDKDYGFAIAQFLYTPSDVKIESRIENDRPYAAWLYGGFIVSASKEKQIDYIELDIGIVGPHAYGEEVQTKIHEWTDSRIPQGWDNQIDETIGVDLTYQRKYRYNIPEDFGGESFEFIESDIIPHFSATLGNIHTHFNVGAVWRIGHNLPDDFGYVRMEPSPRIIKDYGFYLFASLDNRYVIRNILVDGNGGVTKEDFVSDFSVGMTLILGKFDIIYAYNIRTPEIEEQKRNNEFGTIVVSYKF